MNYRHAFHAGNFADVIKHAALLRALSALMLDPKPVQITDTHGGAGEYDLEDAMARVSGEAAEGIGRLRADGDAPAAFGPLKTVVRAANPRGGMRHYPGSPGLMLRMLRDKDWLTACELRPDDFGALKKVLNRPRTRALQVDGFVEAPKLIDMARRNFVLIDPPFERRDDYENIVVTTKNLLRRDPDVCMLIWMPLKDLETFDRFLRGLEAAGIPALVAEARLRGLDDPMRLNGCALAVINDPPGLEAELQEICAWSVRAFGNKQGRAEVWRL